MPVPHNKVIVSFTNSDNQVSSISVVVSSPSPVVTQANLSAWAVSSAAWIQANIGASLKALYDAGTSLASVKCLYMLGKVQVAGAIAQLVTPVPGTGATPHPAQVAAVFSLLTPLSGKSFRGRIYWPADGAAINAGGTFSGSLATQALDMSLFLKGGISAVAGAPAAGVIAVYSVTRDLVTTVNNLRAGNVPDIQRRRRQKSETTVLQVM